MITKNDITNFIDKIPPAPEVLKETINHVNAGDLAKAAKSASSDIALATYLRTLVNRPIFGFKNEVNDISQIFGILGASSAKQVLHNYMISLLSPNDWKLFALNETLFFDFQAELSMQWKKILHHLNINESTIESAITLLPASIIVCEALFCSKIEEVTLLKRNNNIDYNTILKRLSGFSLFEVCVLIAKKWQMQENIYSIVFCASGYSPSPNKEIDILAKWMHLLLFYTLSKPLFIQANLNDFIDFNTDYVEEITPDFMQLMSIS